MRIHIGLLILLTVFLISGCQEDSTPLSGQTAGKQSASPTVITVPDLTIPAHPDAVPPSPPLFEDFEGQPQLSLFPRVGDYRPEEDSDRLPIWRTFIEHLTRSSAIVTVSRHNIESQAWSFRSINSIDSVGYFSPIAVHPETAYTVDFVFKAALPEKTTAGIGILEFDKFLWAADQFPESLMKRHSRGVIEGLRLEGEFDWHKQSFTFKTGPQTGMIHLVLFREGLHDRTPVLFDEIRITPAEKE